MSFQLLNSLNLISGSVLNVYDSTGTYNPVTNPTGWETPNPARASITSATVSIYLPEATTPQVTTTVTSIVQNATSEEFLLKAYSLADLGETGVTLPDGIYRILYTVVSSGVTYTYDQYFLSYYTVKSCVFSKFANFIDSDCSCTKDTSEMLTQWSMLKAIMFGVAGGNLDQAQEMLTKLEAMCNTENCC